MEPFTNDPVLGVPNLVRLLPMMALILVSAFWGIHAVVGKSVESELAPFQLTVLRFTFGAILYAPFSRRVFRLSGKHLIQLGLTGLLWAVIYPLMFYESLHYITPVESLLFINTVPVIAAVLGWVFLRERIRVQHGIGIGISFVGIACTTVGQMKATGSVIGFLTIMAAAVAFAAYTVSSRSLSKQLSVLDLVAATSIFGAIELWAITLVSGQTSHVFSGLSHLDIQGWEAFLYIVLIVSTVCYILYGYGLKRVTSSVASALTFYPQVLFAGLVQWIWLNIVPTWTTLVSAILILGGVLVMQFPPRIRSELTRVE